MKKKVRILIVEDEAIIAQCMQAELEFMGYEVYDFISTGEEAIIIAKEKNPDVILMDIHLSGKIDGIDAAKEIIAFKKIPIIFITGYSETDFIERSKEINPIAYFFKPVEMFDIKSVIDFNFE